MLGHGDQYSRTAPLDNPPQYSVLLTGVATSAAAARTRCCHCQHQAQQPDTQAGRQHYPDAAAAAVRPAGCCVVLSLLVVHHGQTLLHYCCIVATAVPDHVRAAQKLLRSLL